MNIATMSLADFFDYLMKVRALLKKMPLQTLVQRFVQLPSEYSTYQKIMSNGPDQYHVGTDGFDFTAQSYKGHPVCHLLDGTTPLMRVQYYIHNHNIGIDVWIINPKKGSGRGDDCIGFGASYSIFDNASAAPLYKMLTDITIMKPFIDSISTGDDN